MPYHNSIPDSNRPDDSSSKKSGALKHLVQAEKLMQIAFILPCAMVVGWGAGWGVDHLLHSSWGVPVGLVLGIVAGMVGAIRMAMSAMNSPSSGSRK
jgi:F0F1-type ATP synthase assembly protein I